jgi:hypothetical protein
LDQCASTNGEWTNEKNGGVDHFALKKKNLINIYYEKHYTVLFGAIL